MSTLTVNNASRKPVPMAPLLAGGLLAVLFLYALARSNYLLYHTLVEGFSIIVAALIFVLATRTFKYSGDTLLLFLGNAYLFVGVLDFFHIITYKGIGVLPVQGANMATQLWIGGRYLLAASFLLAAVLHRRRLSASLQFWAFAAVTGLLLLSIMWLQVFPACYIEGRGLTVFKMVSEYLIALVILAALLLFYLRRSQFDRVVYRILMAAMACTVLSELSFTLYIDVYGTMNFVGHIFKLASYVLIFEGVVLRGLDLPYETIFKEIRMSAVTDNLTGLYNRQGFRTLFQNELFLAEKRGLPLGMLLMDLDRFKEVNDKYGHSAGDQVLRDFADLLQQSIRQKDIACRLGGDEFMALIRAGSEGLRMVEERLRAAFSEWSASGGYTQNLGLSIGSSIWEPGMTADYENMVRTADQAMYREKESKNKKDGGLLGDPSGDL